MRSIDYTYYLLVSNTILGVLLMLSSEKIGSFAGYCNKAYGKRIARYTKVSILTFGACVTLLYGSLYIVFLVMVPT